METKDEQFEQCSQSLNKQQVHQHVTFLTWKQLKRSCKKALYSTFIVLKKSLIPFTNSLQKSRALQFEGWIRELCLFVFAVECQPTSSDNQLGLENRKYLNQDAALLFSYLFCINTACYVSSRYPYTNISLVCAYVNETAYSHLWKT